MLTVVIKRNSPKKLTKKFCFLFEKNIKSFKVNTPYFSYRLITCKHKKLNPNQELPNFNPTHNQYLFQKSLKIMGRTKIPQPKAQKLASFLLEKSVNHAFFKLHTKPFAKKLAHQKVVLIDEDFSFVHMIEPLMKVFSNITIITKKNREYSLLAQKMFVTYGTALIVTNYLHNINDIFLIISPKAVNIDEYKLKSDILISPKPQNGVAFHEYSDFFAPIRVAIAQYIPQEVDALSFLQALTALQAPIKDFFDDCGGIYNQTPTNDFCTHFCNLLENLSKS